MRKIIKNIASALTGLLFFLTNGPIAFADVVVKTCPQDDTFKALCDLSSARFPQILSAVLILLLIAAVIAALIFLIYGGIKWITSGGDKTAVEGARSHIIAAIVGLIVAFAAFFIVNLVAQIFLGKPITELKLPSFFTGQ